MEQVVSDFIWGRRYHYMSWARMGRRARRLGGDTFCRFEKDRYHIENQSFLGRRIHLEQVDEGERYRFSCCDAN